MALRPRSTRRRPAHLGPYPLEALARTDSAEGLDRLQPRPPVSFHRPDDPVSIVNAMQDFQALLDATREGLVKPERAAIPVDPTERSNHLKSFAYFCDAAMAGVARIGPGDWLQRPRTNPDVDRLAEKLRTMQPKTLAAGIDVIMAGLREAMRAPPGDCSDHSHALVLLVDNPRAPRSGEPGCDWLTGATEQRGCLRAAEIAVTLSNYLRLLGYPARAHSMAASDVDLDRLALSAGLAVEDEGHAANPFLGRDFGISVVTTTLALAPDRPLAPDARAPLGWRTGTGAYASSAGRRDPFRKRRFVDGPHPFETLPRVDEPTTYIDRANVARVPKRANMFARSLFGDLGPAAQKAAMNGNFVRKSAAAFAFRGPLGAFIFLQDGPVAPTPHPSTADPARNAANVKAASYFLGIDAVGLSECPDWAYYSHDAAGEPIEPYHSNAISMIVDQGFETMEGASGDDWIACSQSMRAYLRFSLLGGVIAQHLRNLGHGARTHTAMDDEVLQPPLLLLSGLGEVSRIGEVILNPFLGPRLKSGAVTTNLPMDHDRPIDFGLQRFCEACNKCARECPSGAITAGPKLMFNGYEIWKSDSQKCTSYRIGQAGGAMCGRCMKTCPWNLEGIFADAPFRWAAMHVPAAAPALARLDDLLGRGGINPAKKWWWNLEMVDDGPYGPSLEPENRRALQRDLQLKYEDQTLAVYPAPLAPPPYPWPFPMDREAGIAAYEAMIPADEHRRRRTEGLPPEHVYTADRSDAPVLAVTLQRVEHLTADIARYEFVPADGGLLPAATAGAHIDVVVAPEFFRQFSLCGDPADRSRYQIAVLREDAGRGGSRLMHRIFEPGRRVFISHPRNHFELVEDASFSYLMGGGIGVTPLIAMGHRLHAIGADFALHYSASSREDAAFLADLERFAWSDRVTFHITSQTGRADFSRLLDHRPGAHVYACGSDGYMSAVMQAAEAAGFAEEARHVEYFTVPELPEYENHPFTLRLARSGRDIPVAAGQAATDALLAAGVHVDIKCSDGLCGVCKARVLSGEVEHRDFVLSSKQRESEIILCQSRAAQPGGVIEIDL